MEMLWVGLSSLCVLSTSEPEGRDLWSLGVQIFECKAPSNTEARWSAYSNSCCWHEGHRCADALVETCELPDPKSVM